MNRNEGVVIVQMERKNFIPFFSIIHVMIFTFSIKGKKIVIFLLTKERKKEGKKSEKSFDVMVE